MKSKLKERVLQPRHVILSFYPAQSLPTDKFSSHYLNFPFLSFQLLGFSVSHDVRGIQTPIYSVFFLSICLFTHLHTAYPLGSLCTCLGPCLIH